MDRKRYRGWSEIDSVEKAQWYLDLGVRHFSLGTDLMVLYAWMKDNGMRTTRESSMAMLYASEVGVWVTDRALQIFGGYGYVKDFPVEKYYRDMKLCTIGEGTSEIQRLDIARELLKKI